MACHSFVPPYDKTLSRLKTAKFSSQPTLSVIYLSSYQLRSLNPSSSLQDRTFVQEYGGLVELSLSKTLSFNDLDAKQSHLTDRVIITIDKLVGFSEKSIYLEIGDEAALTDDRVLSESGE